VVPPPFAALVEVDLLAVVLVPVPFEVLVVLEPLTVEVPVVVPLDVVVLVSEDVPVV
jgi:hypothetical protein